MALTEEQRRSLSAARAAELVLAAARVTVSADSALPEPALAKDTAAEQCRVDDERCNAPVMPLDPIDAVIWRIWVDCALLAAPLNAILADIATNNIVHKARTPPTTTSPHPAAMLSTPPTL
jgi:hypothetical protein